jgi:hypothetical protein
MEHAKEIGHKTDAREQGGLEGNHAAQQGTKATNAGQSEARKRF